MRGRLFAAAGVAVSLTAGLVLSQCFTPTFTDCAFRCGTAAPRCPEQYQCQADGYCHLPDSTVVCAIALDLATASDLGGDAAASDAAETD